MIFCTHKRLFTLCSATLLKKDALTHCSGCYQKKLQLIKQKWAKPRGKKKNLGFFTIPHINHRTSILFPLYSRLQNMVASFVTGVFWKEEEDGLLSYY